MKWGVGEYPADLRQAQSAPERMTRACPGRASARPASLSVPVGARASAAAWWRTPTARRYLFGYLLLAPAVLYVALLVGVPFLFSLYLAMSDASVGDPVARFVGLENFSSALENAVLLHRAPQQLVFTVGAGILKGLLGTMLAFLLLQPFKGRKLVRALVVIPFTLPIAVSVLGWKWMFDSQFSVINWALSRLSLIGSYGSPDWPVWLGQPGAGAVLGASSSTSGAASRSAPSCCWPDSPRCRPRSSTPPRWTAPRSCSASAR